MTRLAELEAALAEAREALRRCERWSHVVGDGDLFGTEDEHEANRASMTPFASRGDVKHGKWCPGCHARRALASPSTVAADVIEAAVRWHDAQVSWRKKQDASGLRCTRNAVLAAVDRLLAERERGA